MDIKQLKELIKDMPDKAKVLMPTEDHSYKEVDANVATALFTRINWTWSEDYGEKSTPEGEYGKRWPVLIIR